MVREGLIPVMLGTAVTAAGAMMRGMNMEKREMTKENVMPMVAAGIMGFGLAHVVLGAIDLSQHRY